MHYKILAVDDNPINLDLIEKSLVDTSYQLLKTTSGREAIKMAGDIRPDLILLDVSMPVLDGFQVCKILKENNQTRHIPVIFLSAKIDPEVKAQGLALGGSDYLTKPFNSLELNARIRAQLAHKRENADILEKIKNMQQEFSGKSHPAESQNELVNLEDLCDTDYIKKSARFIVVSTLKTKLTPELSAFMPFFVASDQLLFISFTGLERTIRCKIVKLMMQNYVLGFVYSKKDQPLTKTEAVNLFESLLREFAPDKVKSGFTFSMGLLDVSANTLQFFAVHQPLPYRFETGGKLEKISGEDIVLSENFNEFVHTVECKFEQNHKLIFINPEPATDETNIQQKVLNEIIWNDTDQVKHSLDLLSNNLSAEKGESLLAVITSLPALIP